VAATNAQEVARLTEVERRAGVLLAGIALVESRAAALYVIVATLVRNEILGQENARLNGSGHLVQAIPATGFSAPQFAQAGPFDLVLANILANPLRQLATPMARHLAPSALVILSGLLTPQVPSVIAAYRARGLVPVRHLRIEGWSSLLLRNAG